MPPPRSTPPPPQPLFLLDRCLAIQLRRLRHLEPRWPTSPPSTKGNKRAFWRRSSTSSGEGSSDGTLTPTSPDDVLQIDELEWALQNGYMLFQSFRDANLKCHWNPLLQSAVEGLQYVGYVSPGTLLVGGQLAHLEVLRATWARKVLQPPHSHVITLLGDVDGCNVTPVQQGHFTPLPEALCWLVFEMGLARRKADLDTIWSSLDLAFPYMVVPSRDVVYNTLGKLIRERKVYHTREGYAIVTPDSYRRTSTVEPTEKSLLMTDQEAIAMAHGQVDTILDGDVTHRNIQCNVVDVIYGGQPGDKVLYGRPPSPTSPKGLLSRTGSLRIFGSKRQSLSELKGGSLRLSPTKARTLTAEMSKYSTQGTVKPERLSVLSRWFRRSTVRKKSGMSTFQAQFPPPEWSDSGTKYLHSVGTQTGELGVSARTDSKVLLPSWQTRSYTSLPKSDECDRTVTISTTTPASRSSTLPRRRPTALSSPPVELPPRTGRYRGSGVAFGEGRGLMFSSSKPPTGREDVGDDTTGSSAETVREVKPQRPKSLHRSLSRDNERAAVDKGQGKNKPTESGLSRKSSRASDKVPTKKNGPKKLALETHFSSDKALNMSSVTGKSIDDVAMNNSRKVVLSPSKSENLSFINVFNEESLEKNTVKAFNINNKTSDTNLKINSSYEKLQEEPQEELETFRTYPSLSELNITFTSLTGQKILQGISVNSIDTLIELNMAADQKQSNIDGYPVKTDFGLV